MSKCEIISFFLIGILVSACICLIIYSIYYINKFIKHKKQYDEQILKLREKTKLKIDEENIYKEEK